MVEDLRVWILEFGCVEVIGETSGWSSRNPQVLSQSQERSDWIAQQNGEQNG